MREEAPAPTYFERPLLKAPHWGWNVVTYLYLGGVMGGLGLVALLADPRRDDERRLRRTARIASFALSAVNPPILISHLGRPERFFNMLRIVKIKSPMSLGAWGLVGYSAVAGANVVRELAESGLVPASLRALSPPALTGVQAILGAFMAGYTGVLLSATANPFWASGKRHIPAACVASGTASACALLSLLSTLERNHAAVAKLERLEMFAGAAELLILNDFRERAGKYARPMFTGDCGRRLRRTTMVMGTLVPIALNVLGGAVRLPKPLERLRTIVASALTLVGGYAFRQALIDGGKISAADPHAAFVQPR